MTHPKILTSVAVGLLCAAVLAATPNGMARATLDQAKLTKGLIHWWKFNGNAMDSAGEIDLTPQGPYEYVPAVMGYGIDLDGATTGIYIRSPRDLQFDASFTISAWVYLRSYPASSKLWSSIIFNGDDRNGMDPYALQVNPEGKMAFLTTGERDNLSEIQAPMPLRKFVLITATYDKKTGSQKLYMDGKVVASAGDKFTLTPLVPLVDGQHAGVGIGTNNGFPNSRYNFGWNGIINDLRIYNRALGMGEVQELVKMATSAK